MANSDKPLKNIRLTKAGLPDKRSITSRRNLGILAVKGENEGTGRPNTLANRKTLNLNGVQNVLQVFDNLGGADGMTAWANGSKEAKSKFYCNIYPKVLPREITGNLNHSHIHAHLEGLDINELRRMVRTGLDREARRDRRPGQPGGGSVLP